MSFITPIREWPDHFFIGVNTCIYIAFWNGYSSIVKTISEYVCVEKNSKFEGNYFCLSKVDPRGRLVVATVTKQLCNPNYPADASLYTIAKSSDVQCNINNLRVSHGLDWNTNKKKYYHNDMCNFTTKEYDWDPETGKLC